MTKKIFAQPEMTVVHFDKDICTDIIIASTTYNGTDAILAPGQRGMDDWDAGY